MNQHALSPVASLIVVALTTTACMTAAPIAPDDNASREVRTSHVETHPAQGPQRVIEGASASVAIDGDGATARIATHGLTPGHVYTLWFVVINAPERCSSHPCKAPDVLGNADSVLSDVRWADGGIADAAGEIELTGRVPAGSWEQGWFGNGFTNPRDAEIHFVVNDHGPVIDGREQAMLTTVREGCTDESVPPPFPKVAKTDGNAGPNRCALVQDAIFVAPR